MVMKEVLLLSIFAFPMASAGIFNFANMLNDYGRQQQPPMKVREHVTSTGAPTTLHTTVKPVTEEMNQLAITLKLAKYWLEQLKTTLNEENTEKAVVDRPIEHEKVPESLDLPQKWLSVGLGR